MLVAPPSPTVTLKTRTGFALAVRAAEPTDEALLAHFFAAVSPEDLRFRFLSALDHVGHDKLAQLVRVDHWQTESFLAFDDDDRLVATAMLACAPAMDVGEVAISMRADVKGRGIGWTLLEHVAHEARRRGVKRLQCIESRDNHSAVELEREMGFKIVDSGDPSIVVLEARF